LPTVAAEATENTTCAAPTTVDYQYRTAAGKFAPLASPDAVPEDAVTVMVEVLTILLKIIGCGL
jgi:hypothetical protein